MADFIQNLNEYINHYGIKQTFIAKRTGIEKNKLSRILNRIQDITNEDMVSISKALDKEVSYFFQEKLELLIADYKESTSIAFYMGTADESKKELANQVFDFLEHIDAILGIRKKLQKAAYEVSEYGI